MKRALNDRFLIASLAILGLAAVILGYFIFEDSGAGSSFGQNLTEDQKANMVDIAMSDPIVKSEIRDVSNWANYFNWSNGSYHVNGVTGPSAFHEIGPGLDQYRALPAVEIVFGDEKDKGVNMFAFVDPGQGRVAYIGYIKRAGADGRIPQEDYRNLSIAYTGYSAGQILAGERRAKAIRVALDNKTVQETMNGKNYTVQGDIVVTNIGLLEGDNPYIGAYPFITFTEGTSISEPDFLIDVVVDVDNDRVLDSVVHVRTPVLRETPTSAA